MFYFILGMFFVLVVIPTIDSLMSLMVSAIEILRTKCAVKIAEYSKKISDCDNPPITTHPIGFSIQSETTNNDD